MNRLVAERLLQQIGYDSVQVGDALEALERARRGDLDAILMDCQMPNMDGFQAASAMRAESIGVPIVAVTASDIEHDRSRLLACSMNGVLQKPLDLASLRGVLGASCRTAEPPVPSRLEVPCS
ncbi:MAG: response regulator [Proteobacteria bacterium]|nr:response regulator [Pseudomonadota bacterium]MCP4920511.1 response regulator [Pseudomonadota bacterium]